jgi:hypothetical protein
LFGLRFVLASERHVFGANDSLSSRGR